MIPKIEGGGGIPSVLALQTARFRTPLASPKIYFEGNNQQSIRRACLLSFQRNVSNSDVRAQLVLAFAAILQGLAEPAAGFAVAVAVHVADAYARMHHAISRGLIGYANVANTEFE